MTRRQQGLHPFRHCITATLEALSPLHVGTGVPEAGVLKEREIDGKTVSPLLARVVRDKDGAFFLPGSTLKNLLRRAEPDPATVRDLFGEVLDTTSGRMGSVFVWGARCTGAAPAEKGPGAACLGNGAFVAARTAIDRKLGSAAEHRLFFQEMVPAGSSFDLDLLVVGDDEAAAERRARAMLTILRRLEAGSTLGKGQADGLGRVRIRPGSIWCESGRIDMDGILTWTDAADFIPAADEGTPGGTLVDRVTLTLRCDGPFMIVDSFHERETDETKKVEAKERAHLKAQRINDGAPLILGSSITGVLRSRAGWLAELDRLQRPPGTAPNKPVDNRDAVCRTRADAAGRTPVERLFGVAGFRGLLSVESLAVDLGPDGTWDTLTSVKLDRFSGAPFDGGLFTSAVFVGVTLTLTLGLHDRSRALCEEERDREVAKPTDDDRKLFDELVKDIDHNGLLLGHGTNRGFGWFDCVEVAR